MTMAAHRHRFELGTATVWVSYAVALLLAGNALAQNPHQPLGADGVPDVPPGNAAIIGQLVHPTDNEKTQGSTVLLYSLASDGSPGVRTVKTDARGTFSFADLSNASGITYLIGASYRGVPYGKRVVFEPGQTEIALMIEVDDPISDTSLISIGTSSLRVEWIGANLGVEEIHQIDNPGEDIVYVAAQERAGKEPPFRTTLPTGASSVDTSLSGVAEGYELRDGQLLFWGPIYQGGLELRFRYLLPIPREREEDLSLGWQLDSGSTGATLLYPPGGPTVSVEGAAAGPEVDLDDVSLRSVDLGPVQPGDRVDMSVALPTLSSDTSAISIPRVDVWLDTDDTFLQVRIEMQMEIAPGAHLAGSRANPLLRFELPEGAELLGASPEAQDMGLLQIEGGDLSAIGPLSPGTASVAFRYRAPVKNGKPHLDLKFPGAVDILNVLIADTGVVIETDRLHRQRPFRQGTRVHLHREAFAIDEGEVIPIGLELIDHGSLSPNAHLFATSAFAAIGVWFIVSPLVRGQRNRGADYEQARIRSERDIVYQSIRDLEHDFETAKIEQAQYQVMREELRARGIALLQRERDAGRAASPQPAQPTTDRASANLCATCGDELQTDWLFCANCGTSVSGQAGATEVDA